MNKLSYGKIEIREGNTSGNLVIGTQKDVERMGEDIRKARIDANLSHRQLFVVGNSYANRLVPLACEWAQNKYLDPTIKADLYIGTGDPGFAIGATTEHLRKASIREPVIIGSSSDLIFFKIPYSIAKDLTAHYEIFSGVRHAGKMGYFDNPASVKAIMNNMGLTPPPLLKIGYFSEQINNLYTPNKVDILMPSRQDFHNVNQSKPTFTRQELFRVPSVELPGIQYKPLGTQLYKAEVPRVWERNYFINQINSQFVIPQGIKMTTPAQPYVPYVQP
ncbi:MAG: hypothetical protein NTZ92_06730 [Candidatus Omnitrophica bacterium]|nr:hypothetical protein [Candidatus Omnitrophota bacterium]